MLELEEGTAERFPSEQPNSTDYLIEQLSPVILRAGMRAGVAAALTLLSVIAIIWAAQASWTALGRSMIAAQERADSERELAIKPVFLTEFRAYIQAIGVDRAATKQSWKAFEVSKKNSADAFKSLSSVTTTQREKSLRDSIYYTEEGFDECVGYAIGPGYHIHTLKECNDSHPYSEVQAIVDTAK